VTTWSRAFDRITEPLARWLADWTLRHAPEERREWARAMRAELDVIEIGWHKLRWAVSALSLAVPRPGEATGPHLVPSHSGGTVENAQRPWVGLRTRAVAFNIAAFAVAWIAFATTASLTTVDSWATRQMAILAGAAVGWMASIAVRAEPMAYFLAGQVAFGATELVFHLTFGIGTVQGFAAHWSVMTSGTLAACFAGALLRLSSLPASAPRFDARDLGATVRGAMRATWERSPALALVVLVVVSAMAPEAAFNLLGVMNSTPLYRDGVTHVAVVVSAVVGAAGGAVIDWRMRTPRTSRVTTV